MLHGATFNLADASPRIASHFVASGGTLDRWMVLGFVTAVVLLASLSVQQRSIPLLVLRSVCLGALAVFGFEQGTWPLGLVLAVMFVRQLLELSWHSPSGVRSGAMIAGRRANHFARESRFARLFGDDSRADADPRVSKTKPVDDDPHDGGLILN